MNHVRQVRALVLAASLVIGCQSVPAASSPAPPGPTATAAGASPLASAGAPTAAWRRITDIPTARSEVAAVVAQQQSRVFVIGGFRGPDRVERYDPAADRWERAPDLPVGVDHPMAAASEGLQSAAPQGVFVFGGYLANGSASAPAFRSAPPPGRWGGTPPIPGPRAPASRGPAGVSIFIVGGANGSGLIAPTYGYNGTTR